MVMDSLVYLVYSRFLEHLVGAQSSDSCVILYKIDLIWNFVWYFFFFLKDQVPLVLSIV